MLKYVVSRHWQKCYVLSTPWWCKHFPVMQGTFCCQDFLKKRDGCSLGKCINQKIRSIAENDNTEPCWSIMSLKCATVVMVFHPNPLTLIDANTHQTAPNLTLIYYLLDSKNTSENYFSKLKINIGIKNVKDGSYSSSWTTCCQQSKAHPFNNEDTFLVFLSCPCSNFVMMEDKYKEN